MSQKKHKQLRREGKDRKTANCSRYEKCNLSKLRLIPRNQLLSILKWLERKWYVDFVQSTFSDSPSCENSKNISIASLDEELEDIFSESNTGNTPTSIGLKYYVKNLKPLHSARTGRYAIPVSLYHDKKTGECLYQVWSVEDYTSYVVGSREISKETAHLPKSQRTYVNKKIAPQRTPVSGGVNTVLLSLGFTSQLEEHLPTNGVTLDDLIWLGRHDEEFSPLSFEEMMDVLRVVPRSRLSEFYEVQDGKVSVRCITYADGTEYYQPEKTRFAWGLTVASVPVEFTDTPGVALVPVYRTGQMTRCS